MQTGVILASLARPDRDELIVFLGSFGGVLQTRETLRTPRPPSDRIQTQRNE